MRKRREREKKTAVEIVGNSSWCWDQKRKSFRRKNHFHFNLNDEKLNMIFAFFVYIWMRFKMRLKSGKCGKCVGFYYNIAIEVRSVEGKINIHSTVAVGMETFNYLWECIKETAKSYKFLQQCATYVCAVIPERKEWKCWKIIKGKKFIEH